MKHTKPEVCTWIIEGSDWNWIYEGKTDDDIMELATKALEEFDQKEGWQREGRFVHSDMETPFTDESVLSIGLAIKFVHDKMKSTDDHIFMFTPQILANAGDYRSAYKLQKDIENERNGLIKFPNKAGKPSKSS